MKRTIVLGNSHNVPKDDYSKSIVGGHLVDHRTSVEKMSGKREWKDKAKEVVDLETEEELDALFDLLES